MKTNEQTNLPPIPEGNRSLSLEEVKFRAENMAYENNSILIRSGGAWQDGGWKGNDVHADYITSKPPGYFLDPKTLTETE